MIKILFKRLFRLFYAGNNELLHKRKDYYSTNFTRFSQYFQAAHKKLELLIQQKNRI